MASNIVHWSLLVANSGRPECTDCGVEAWTENFTVTHDPTKVTCKTCLRGTAYRAWIRGHGTAKATKKEAWGNEAYET